MNAIDKVTIEVDYARPKFDFPDLGSPEGSVVEFYAMAERTLVKSGFKMEAHAISKAYFKMPYEDHFNFLARYLDFSIPEKQTTEDDEYIYIKIKKTPYHTNELTQPEVLRINSISDLQDAIRYNEDLSTVNCYNRNILNYMSDSGAIRFFLEQNKQHNWVDLFSIDYFGGTILHNNKDLRSFRMILQEIYYEDSYMTPDFFLMSDVFGNNAARSFLKLLNDHLVCQPGNTRHEVTSEKVEDIGLTLGIIKNINIDLYNDINAMINNSKNNKKFHTVNMDILNAAMLASELDTSLDDKTSVVKKTQKI